MNEIQKRVVEITTNERIGDKCLQEIKKLFTTWVPDPPIPKWCISFHGEYYRTLIDHEGNRYYRNENNVKCIVKIFPTIIKVPEPLFLGLKEILNTAKVNYAVIGYWDFTPGEPEPTDVQA